MVIHAISVVVVCFGGELINLSAETVNREVEGFSLFLGFSLLLGCSFTLVGCLSAAASLLCDGDFFFLILLDDVLQSENFCERHYNVFHLVSFLLFQASHHFCDDHSHKMERVDLTIEPTIGSDNPSL